MTQNDRVLLSIIAGLALLITITGLIVRAHIRQEPATVTVIHHHTSIAYALTKERTIDIGTHHIEIHHSAARITHAQCRDKVCEKAGWVSDGIIVCAPFKLAVIITPQEKTSIDATTY